MIAIFVNSRRTPFVDLIRSKQKRFETRTRNMLGRFIGEQVMFAETGNGSPLVKCSAVISEVISVRSRSEWERYRQDACIPLDSDYDWKPETKVKWLYRLSDVQTVAPFPLPPDAVRHGRTFAEFSY